MEPLLLEIQSQKHTDFVEITSDIQTLTQQAGWQDGIVHLFTQHTTCGLTINENADPDVTIDLEYRLEKLAPWHASEDRHQEGNSAAHLKCSLLGVSLQVPLWQSKLQLGTWQGIYLADFDGPRRRKVLLQFIES